MDIIKAINCSEKMEQKADIIRYGNTSSFVKLAVNSLSLSFGGQQVLNNIHLELLPGQIGLLSGANGCGKTTLLNILSGFLKPDSGCVNLVTKNNTINILSKSSEKLPHIGIARLWQDVRLFPTMTALENVLTASPSIGINPFYAVFWPRKVREQEQQFIKQAKYWLEMLEMQDRADSSGDKLSVGQTKRVAIARLLQTGADILLLDEPLAGLDKSASQKLVTDLEKLAKRTGKCLLIVEHDKESILSIADYHYQLVNGMIETKVIRS